MAMARLFALSLLLVVGTSVSVSSLEYTPVYTWSNTGSLGDGGAAQVQYQTLSASDIVVNKISSQVFSSQKSPKGALLAVLIDKVVESSTQVQAFVTDAESSIVFPNAQATSNSQLAEQLASHLQSNNVAHMVVGCGEGSSTVEDVDFASSDLQAIVICPSDSGIKDVQGLQSKLQDSKRSYIAVYMPHPQTPRDASGDVVTATRRSLLASNGFGPYTVCDGVCQTQVRWLEGILAGLLLALASMSGLCCLYFLDTPTKFEAPKDNTQ